MKIKTNMFFWRLNNEFANILQKVRSFCPLFFSGRLLEAGIPLLRNVEKMVIFRVQIGGGHLLEHGHLLEILRYL